ncbi:MAG: sensor histidine kinase N-terminal domain-containing protein [Candidatus Obscuribacterales bacterium]|nr:sensor histidine kinase N-terminal domain-containing protein [Candidatus Obscuribacterales bacterium]
MKQHSRSIKADLLKWLLLPLCSLCLISTAVAYFLASHFANDSYDRNLINTADSVAGRVRISNDGNISLDLPPAALEILRHSHPKDKFYYQVLNPDGSKLGGDQIPSVLEPSDSSVPIISYVQYAGQTLRLARIRIPIHDHPEKIILVEAAETLNSRNDLTSHILISILIPQILLILFGIIAVSFGIAKGLRPLADLRSAVVERSRSDLRPIDESIAPIEAQPLANSINDLLGRLRADIEAQRRFVANAAHQLQTPLAGIQTYTEIVERTAESESSKNLLQQILKGVGRMSHLVKQLLVLAKSEPRDSFVFEKVDLNVLVSDGVSDLIPKALEKNIELEFTEADQAAVLMGEPVNLKELVANLVENAIIYGNRDGLVSIRVLVNSDNSIALEVEDDGPGIPDDEREKVVERFYRVLGTQVEGSGLGLAIVKEIADAHGAEFSLLPGRSGKGTLVTIVFSGSKK